MTPEPTKCCENCLGTHGEYKGMCINKNCPCHSPQPQQEGWEKWTDGDWKVRLPWVSGEIADDGENLLTFGMSRIIAFIKALLTSATREARMSGFTEGVHVGEVKSLQWVLTKTEPSSVHCPPRISPEVIRDRLASLKNQ